MGHVSGYKTTREPLAVTRSRHTPSPAELVDFCWPRMREPQWAVRHAPVYVNGIWEPSAEARVLVGDEGELIQPLRSEPALFRNFAALQDTESAFANFAQEYGDLWNTVPLALLQDSAVSILRLAEEFVAATDTESPAPFQRTADALASFAQEYSDFVSPAAPDREEEDAISGRQVRHTLFAWSGERQQLARAIRLWDALTSGRPQDVIGPDVQTTPTTARSDIHGDVWVSVRFPDSGERLLGAWRRLGLVSRKSSPRRIVQDALSGLVSLRSQARIALAPIVAPGDRVADAGLRLTYTAETLSDALWLQLALAIDGNRRYETCPVCGEQWDATDARSDRETCSDRCRKRRNREAKGAEDHA